MTISTHMSAGFLALLVGFCSTSRAEDIAIVGVRAQKSSISVRSLSLSESSASRLFRSTLENDLKRSGWFNVVAGKSAIVVGGSCRESGDRLVATCEVKGASTGRNYLTRTFSGDASAAHKLAHEVADAIVLAVKGVRGMASSHIAMVGQRNGRKDIYLCGADGGDLVQLTKNGSPCISPSWSPDGSTILYTSFHRGFPDVYEIDFATRQRKRIASYPGMNAGAELARDGSQLALTLSKDGNPELYVKSIRRGTLTRLTKTRYAAEASPSWSPDGRRIVFVSDRSGSPQLYVVGRNGGRASRITFRGNENVSPDWGDNGRIVYSSRRMGRYQICVYDPRTRAETQLTSAYVDHEDPSWGPDGRHIVYSRTERYRSVLYLLDTLGDPEVVLTKLDGDWYFPAWSPR